MSMVQNYYPESVYSQNLENLCDIGVEYRNNYLINTCSYQRGTFTPGYVAPITDVTFNQEMYKFNPQSDTYEFEKYNNKGKATIKTLTSGFHIQYVTRHFSESEGIRFITICYSVRREIKYEVINAEDYQRGNYSKYFRDVFRFPACSKQKFNELVSFLLQTVPTQDEFLRTHQGWNKLPNGMATFAYMQENVLIPIRYLPESIRKRRIANMVHTSEVILQNWLRIYASHPTLKFIGYYRIGSLLLFFLHSMGIIIKQFMIVEPTDTDCERKLTAMLKTNTEDGYTIPTLESGEEVITKTQAEIYDGIAVYAEHSFADEVDQIRNGLKTLVKAVRRELPDAEYGRNLAAVISRNAAYAAAKLAPENIIVLNMDHVQIDADADEIRAVTAEMDAFVINAVSSRLLEIFSLLDSRQCKPLGVQPFEEETEMMKMIIITEKVLRVLFNHHTDIDDLLAFLGEKGDDRKKKLMDAHYAIITDFASVLSDRIRSGECTVLQKCNQMRIDPESKNIIVAGNRVYISGDLLSETLSLMKTTHNQKGLINTLRHSNILTATDGDTHPIDAHDLSGQYRRLYYYDISAEILDADVVHRLNNLDCAPFWLTSDQAPKDDFIAVLNDGCGNIAGKQICYREAENSSCYITGQSGFGKTFLLCQLIAKHHAIGHQIVVFDSSDSFTYEAMCRNLSKEYVDNNIVFHDIDRDGIPVDLFSVNRSGKPSTQKKDLFGILTAGIGELSGQQKDTLRSALSKMLLTIEIDAQIRTDDILAKLKEHSETNKSLRNRLIPLFEDIDSYGMSDQSWGSYLQCAGKMIVIHTESGFTDKGYQIIDMLLATLFDYQRENPGIPLDIFIDEVQNQNYSAKGPICKMLKEGRKYHLSFFGATQDYYPRNTELGSVMGKAGTQFFLRPTQNSEGIAASELRFGKTDMTRFDVMQRGDVIAKGSFYNHELGKNVSTTLSGHVDAFLKCNETENE